VEAAFGSCVSLGGKWHRILQSYTLFALQEIKSTTVSRIISYDYDLPM
jgi:hypothetical protein